MKKIFTLALILIIIIKAKAQEKVLIVSDSDDNMQIYIYPSTIKKSGNNLRVWLERQYTSAQYTGNEYYMYTKELSLIDCNGMRISNISRIYYAGNNTAVSHRKWSEYQAEQELEFQPPATIGWRIIEETCERRNYLK